MQIADYASTGATRMPRWAYTLACVLATLAAFATQGTSPALAETCPNEPFRQGPSASLPECRAYELVTPVEKNGLEAEFKELSPSGESVSIGGHGVLLPRVTDEYDGFSSNYTLTRGKAGWTPTSTAPPATEYIGPFGFLGNLLSKYLSGMSLDGRSTLWVTRRRSDPEPEARVSALYLQRTPGGPLTEVGPVAPPSWPPPELSLTEPEAEAVGTTEVIDYSQDLSHVLLIPSEWALDHSSIVKYQWPSAETAKGDPTLYEYLGTGNTEPLPVGVNNEGKVISNCGTVLGARGPEIEPRQNSYEYTDNDGVNGDNPMSADGSTVFFIARAHGEEYVDPYTLERAGSCDSGLVANELYARIDNGEPGAHTVSISEPTAAACPACDTAVGVRKAAYFQGASEDGSKVFFTTEQPLLGKDTTNNIYEYDLDAKPGEEAVVRVSGGDGTLAKEPEAADVKGVSAISDDGSHVYFVAGGVLTLNPSSQGQEAVEGADNLYVFDTQTRTTSFIADLCFGLAGEKERSGAVTDPDCHAENKQQSYLGPAPGSDNALWGHDPRDAGQSGKGLTKIEEGELETHSAPVGIDTTPNGQFLVFKSFADLTPGDTSTAAQVFEYDAQTGALVRVSVGQDGFNDDGNTDDESLAAQIVSPGFQTAGLSSLPSQRLTVSADGSDVFFQSALGLTPQALNGAIIGQVSVYNENTQRNELQNVYANNVYEYHDGSVYLISDGKDVGSSEGGASVVSLLGTDPSGRDLFFTTDDALVSQDTDDGPDVYDARVDGGFPAPEAPVPCSGDECQGQLSGAPVLLSPGSEFQAGGNPPLAPAPAPAAKPKAKPRACKQGKVRKHGACVPKRKAKKAKQSDRRAHR